MALRYMVESNASHAETNTEKNDNIRIVQYIYDLELDQNGNIIGGEWYQNIHPDFIWSLTKDSKAQSVSDRDLRSEWLDSASVPSEWKRPAQHASEYGQPLGPVVEGLIKRSKTKKL